MCSALASKMKGLRKLWDVLAWKKVRKWSHVECTFQGLYLYSDFCQINFIFILIDLFYILNGGCCPTNTQKIKFYIIKLINGKPESFVKGFWQINVSLQLVLDAYFYG